MSKVSTMRREERNSEWRNLRVHTEEMRVEQAIEKYLRDKVEEGSKCQVWVLIKS